MVQLFWCPNTRSTRALWMLEELGVPYETVLIDVRKPGSPRPSAFKAASPMGKVPAMTIPMSDGALAMSESAAICLHLADAYPEAGLTVAADRAARGQFLYWMFYTPGVIEPAMAERFGKHDTAKASHGWGDFDTMIQVLEDELADDLWLMGDAFSAADVINGSTIHFMKMFGILPESPVLEAYLKRCLARPAYKKALQINQDAATAL